MLQGIGIETKNSTKLLVGDNMELLKTLGDNSLDSVVTDPPYGLKFMSKKWDHSVPSLEFWKEVLRVLKPGGHVLSFGGTRTYHRMAVNIEDAGFEIRDQIQWNFGSGFPKSHNVYKTAKTRGLICECDVKLSNEDLSSLQKAVATEKPVSESQKQDLLKRVLCKNDISIKEGQSGYNNKENDSELLGLSKTNRKNELSPKESTKPDLFEKVQRSAQGTRLEGLFSPGALGLDGRVEEKLRKENVRGEEPCLEGRSDLQKEQGQLHRSKVCEVPERVSSDVEKRRLCNGTQVSDGNVDWQGANSERDGSSQGPQDEKQQENKSGTMALQPEPQDVRSGLLQCSKCKKPRLRDGLGTALKPANEPIAVARKPLSEKTIVDNVLKWGVGCINIDDCRVEGISDSPGSTPKSSNGNGNTLGKMTRSEFLPSTQGRFPANVILDEQAGQVLDEQTPNLNYATKPNKKIKNDNSMFGLGGADNSSDDCYGKNSKGGASRFFYCAKASKKERNAGLTEITNGHPTVKPIKLMEYLIKLVTPTGGTVLDPFMGSGSTGLAAKNLGFDFVGMELNEEYFKIASKRLDTEL